MTGIEWMIEAFGCSAATLSNKAALRALFNDAEILINVFTRYFRCTQTLASQRK